MWGTNEWCALYRARAEHLRGLADETDDEGARLVLLWAAKDYELMAVGREPDEQRAIPVQLLLRTR